MKKKFLVVAIAMVFCAAGAEKSAAQDKLEVGAQGGMSFYMGELNPMRLFDHPRPALGGLVRYNFTDRLAAKAVATLVGIAGEYPSSGDVYAVSAVGTHPDYKFEKTLLEVAAMGEFNFRSFDHMFKKDDSKWAPYLTAGVGVVLYTSYDDRNGSEKVFVLSLPFGFGAKYKVNKWLRVGAEWRICKTFADDLDYVGSTAGSLNTRDPYGFDHKALLNNNDWYQVIGVSASLSMWPRRLECNDGIRSYNK